MTHGFFNKPKIVNTRSITCVLRILNVPASFLGRTLCSLVSVLGLIIPWDELKHILKNFFYILLKKH
jgi:hypothetical protein